MGNILSCCNGEEPLHIKWSESHMKKEKDRSDAIDKKLKEEKKQREKEAKEKEIK